MKILHNIGNFFLKTKWRLVVLIIAILLVAGYFVPNGRRQTADEKGTTTQKPLTAQEQAALSQSKSTLISHLPYISDKFTVEYFPDRDYFFVQIQKQPYETNKLEAEAWLKQNGVDPNYVTVKWGSVRGAGPSK